MKFILNMKFKTHPSWVGLGRILGQDVSKSLAMSMKMICPITGNDDIEHTSIKIMKW